MPGYDGTGPQGRGPMTGGGRGYCVMPAGNVRTIGQGRGWRNSYYAKGIPGWRRCFAFNQGYVGGYTGRADITADEEKNMLKAEADGLRKQLEGIEERLSLLERAH